MKGIDVSRWNGWPFNRQTEAGYKVSDFVIVKATQGTSYSRTDYFRKAIDRVLKDGKLGGAYHYAAGKDAIAEADFFVSVVKPYIGRIVLALDWEAGGNRAWGSTSWARRFVMRVRQKTGVTPMVYTGNDGVRQCGTCHDVSLLWFAGYPTGAANWSVPTWPSRYKTAPWKSWSIWQFTSGGKLDRNITGLTPADWKRLCGAQAAQEAPKQPQAQKPTASTKQGYSGAFPTLPLRGYYKYGDGIKTLKNHQTQIKRIQSFLVWGGFLKGTIDGKYGPQTELAVRNFQVKAGFPSKECDCLFGKKTLAAAKKYKK